jgi:hypothetical protein
MKRFYLILLLGTRPFGSHRSKIVHITDDKELHEKMVKKWDAGCNNTSSRYYHDSDNWYVSRDVMEYETNAEAT